MSLGTLFEFDKQIYVLVFYYQISKRMTHIST